MIASSRTLIKRLMVLLLILAFSYLVLFFYYISQTNMTFSNNKIINNDNKVLAVIIADHSSSISVFLDSFEEILRDNTTGNLGVMLGGFGSKIDESDIKQFAEEFNNKYQELQIVKGEISDYAYKHAIAADTGALIAGYSSILVITPGYYMPKLKMLFKIITEEDKPLYFKALPSAELPSFQNLSSYGKFKLIMYYYHDYIYLKWRYLLHKFFELVGFGQRETESLNSN